MPRCHYSNKNGGGRPNCWGGLANKTRSARVPQRAGSTGPQHKEDGHRGTYPRGDGENSATKADRLALVLTGLMAGKNVKVARPVKMAKVRVTDLDDSIIPQKLASALAKASSCGVEEVRVGEFRRSARRLSAAWAKMPAAALNKVLPGGHLLVGWARVRIELLDPCPL